VAYASAEQRALVTRNISHFPTLCALWMEAQREHWGVIILTEPATLGDWLRRLEGLLQHESSEQLRNRLLYLGVGQRPMR